MSDEDMAEKIINTISEQDIDCFDSDEDEITVVCTKVKNVPKAYVPSLKKNCYECDCEVWIDENIEKSKKPDNYICMECFMKQHSNKE
jgi:hypothetical protein